MEKIKAKALTKSRVESLLTCIDAYVDWCNKEIEEKWEGTGDEGRIGLALAEEHKRGALAVRLLVEAVCTAKDEQTPTVNLDEYQFDWVDNLYHNRRTGDTISATEYHSLKRASA